MTERVAVYGTLRRGMFYYSEYMKDAEFLMLEVVSGFLMYKNPEDHYPFIVPGDGSIVCEIFSVKRSQLDLLDELEELPVMYRREKIQVSGQDAWIYVFNLNIRPDSLHIPSGDWVEYHNKNS